MQYEIYSISHNQEHKIAEVVDLALAQKFVERLAPRFAFERYEARQKTETDILRCVQHSLYDYKAILEHSEKADEEMRLCAALSRLLDARIVSGVTSNLEARINMLRERAEAPESSQTAQEPPEKASEAEEYEDEYL